jgi:rSAM/selenodomain-associated transferase 1
MCVTAELAPVQLWCAPDTRHHTFSHLHHAFGVRLVPQPEGDLGMRMQAAFQEALRQSEFALLIGTDCPVMNADYLESAFVALHAGEELVVGPAEDGGYVLLAARKISDSLFRNISWGTGDVLRQTRKRIEVLGYRYRELPSLWDVDYYKDLQRLLSRTAVQEK